MFRKTTLWLVVLLAAISFSIACGGGQEEEANKLVNEANALNTKSKETVSKIQPLFTGLLGDAWMNAEDNAAYFAENKAKVDELVSLNEQDEKAMNEIAGKFDQASKLQIDAKFKEYLGLKSQEFKKLSEYPKAQIAFLKSIAVEKENEKAGKMLEDYKKNSADINKAATDASAKAEKFMKDNPDIFKK